MKTAILSAALLLGGALSASAVSAQPLGQSPRQTNAYTTNAPVNGTVDRQTTGSVFADPSVSKDNGQPYAGRHLGVSPRDPKTHGFN